MLTCIAFAYILGTSKIECPQPKIEIVLVESNSDKEARLNREQQERERKVLRPSPAYESRSDVKIIGDSTEQCVEAYKRLSGRYRPLGYAGNIPSQGDIPVVGAGALFKNYGHIGYITNVSGDTITVIDANFVRGKLTKQVLNVDNFRGFLYN